MLETILRLIRVTLVVTPVRIRLEGQSLLNRVDWSTTEPAPAEIKPLLQQPVVVEQAGSRNQEAHEL